MLFTLINSSWASRLSSNQRRHKTSWEIFLTSVASLHIIKIFEYYHLHYLLLYRTVHVLDDDFPEHRSFKIFAIFYLWSYITEWRIYNRVKFESSPPPFSWRGRACLATNLTFEIIFSKFYWFIDLLLSKAVDIWAEISPQTLVHFFVAHRFLLEI